MSVTRLLDRVGDALDRWGVARVLLSLLATFHLGFAAALALLPPYLMSSPALGVLMRSPASAGLWGLAYGAVGIAALLELALPCEPAYTRTRHAVSAFLWMTALPLVVVWTVGLGLPCLPMFGGVGNVLGVITWGVVLAPLWAYTMRLTTGAARCGSRL